MTIEAVSFPMGGVSLSLRGALATPASVGRHGALVVVHEWWGLNDEIKAQAERFAGEGFLALAVDLYGGESTDRAERALELSSAMKTADAMLIIQAAVSWLASHERSNGKVGVTGFCLGGAMALAAASNVDGLCAVVPFYGVPREDFIHPERMKAPIQGHYAKVDAFVSPERPPSIAARVREAGGSMEAFFYDGGHAFLRNDPATYHEESAVLAWSRATKFLREHLA